jgi:hypothetical protein
METKGGETMEKRMTLHDYDVHQENTKPISEIAKRVLTHLEISHMGKQNGVSRENLELSLDISGREIRRCIIEIIEKTDVVIGNDNGYYICITDEEIQRANELETKRIKTSLKRIASNGTDNLEWVHAFVQSLRKTNKKHPDGQLNIKEEVETYKKGTV